MRIEKITPVRVREVWPHEAHDFTTWLETNIDVLDDDLVVAIDPDSVRREEAAGSLWVDLVAEDQAGRTVIVENQLGKSDHDHLGKVITYTAAFDADVAIWIVADPRPEHVKAVSWINDSTPLSAYMFKIQAIRIGDSAAAPLLTLIVGPSDASKEIAQTKTEKSERHGHRRAFFDRLLEHAGERTKLHSGRTGTDGPYLGGSSGQPGIQFVYGVRQHETTVHLWIERGRDWADWNNEVYRHLLGHKTEIEIAYGAPLQWDAKDTNRSRKLLDTLSLGGWAEADRWDDAIEETVSRMLRLEAAVKPQLANAVAFADQSVPAETERQSVDHA